MFSNGEEKSLYLMYKTPPFEDFPPRKWRTRFQWMFIRACALTVVIWLFFYGFILTDTKYKAADELTESWNMSLMLQSAFSKIHDVILLPKVQKKRKLVILWTSFFNSNYDWLPSTKDLHCPVHDCDATSDRSLLNRSDVVLLHWRNVDLLDLPECVPNETVRCPLWALFNEEAPLHTSRSTLEMLQNKVHWTVTYRRDSDVFAPYGKVVARKENHKYLKPDSNPNRRLVCWLVSNCNTPSKREIFVNELGKHIEVDIYGKCGNATCPYQLVKDCYLWLSKRCKFYLSFENSNCVDYTTEKLYYAMMSGMVPVVLGSRRNYAHLPPRSHVNAADFSSPKELAKYLFTIGNDENAYSSYFSWLRQFEVMSYGFVWFCDLCEKLHNSDLATVKSRQNLASWWFDQSECMG